MDITISPNGRDGDTRGVRAALGRAAIDQGTLVLICERPGLVDDQLVAYVNGIPIGESARLSALAEGEKASIQCGYFPCVSLPCQIRVGLKDANQDIAPLLAIQSADEVQRLVGHGRLEDLRLTLQNGVVVGAAINKVNGLGRPLLLGRINGHMLRNIQVEPPRMRDEGGCYVSFTMAVEPSDLGPSGATYEILKLPEMTLLGTLAFPRSDDQALALSVGRLEASVDGLHKQLRLELARAHEVAEQQRQQSQHTLESVVEYLLALMFDRFANKQDASAAKLENDALADFRRLIADHGDAELGGRDYLQVPPDSLLFVDGWFELEQDERRFDIRWMGPGSSLLNPRPSRPIAAVTFTVGVTADGAVPQLTAAFDADPVDVEVTHSPNGAPYTVKLLPRPRGKAMPALVVRLNSTQVRRNEPGNGDPDRRVLSMAVLGATFYFGES